MSTTARILTYLFQFANLGIFIAFLYYLYKRYFKQTLILKQDQEQRIIDGLYSEQQVSHRLYHHYKELETRTQERHTTMQRALLQWQHIIAQEQERQLLEKNNRATDLQRKALLQQELLHTMITMRTIAPETIKQVRHTLEQDLNDIQKHEFIHHIITYLQKNNRESI